MLILDVVLSLLLLNARAQQLPDTQPGAVRTFVAVAFAEATPRVPADLLVSLAWAESRFESQAGPACGVMQVFPRDIGRPASDCQIWRRDVTLAVRAGVLELEMMLEDKRVHGSIRRALMYRACGNAFFDGTCSHEKSRWVDAVLARWRWLRAPLARS